MSIERGPRPSSPSHRGLQHVSAPVELFRAILHLSSYAARTLVYEILTQTFVVTELKHGACSAAAYEAEMRLHTSQLADAHGVNRPQMSRALSQLLAGNVVIRTQKGGYKINPDPSTWK